MSEPEEGTIQGNPSPVGEAPPLPEPPPTPRLPDPPPAPTPPALYEEGFLALLLIAAISGLVWLFFPFLPGLLLALILAASTYPIFERLMHRFQLERQRAAGVMTAGVFLFVITPVVYILSVAGMRAMGFIAATHQRILALDAEELAHWRERILERIPLPEETIREFLPQLGEHVGKLAGVVKNVSLFLFNSLFGNTLAFLASLLLILFALFFFYRDGPSIVARLKILSPLPNELDSFIINRFSGLATVLTLSTVGVALLQGTAFAFITLFMGLPWLFMGVAVAVTSFIPVLGAFVVWGPAVLWLYLKGHPYQALTLTIWSVAVIGFVIDNLARPVIMAKLAAISRSEGPGGDSDILSHTLLTVLSTLGGVLAFGILGLLFGPLMAAMAITVFDIYQRKHGDQLDHS